MAALSALISPKLYGNMFSTLAVLSAGAASGQIRMDKTEVKERRAFERAAEALRADVTGMAAMVTHDGNIRATYSRKIAQITATLRQEVRAGRMTWAEAATEAQRLRNETMEILRHRSSPIGRSITEQLKQTGRTLNTWSQNTQSSSTVPEQVSRP